MSGQTLNQRRAIRAYNEARRHAIETAERHEFVASRQSSVFGQFERRRTVYAHDMRTLGQRMEDSKLTDAVLLAIFIAGYVWLIGEWLGAWA